MLLLSEKEAEIHRGPPPPLPFFILRTSWRYTSNTRTFRTSPPLHLLSTEFSDTFPLRRLLLVWSADGLERADASSPLRGLLSETRSCRPDQGAGLLTRLLRPNSAGAFSCQNELLLSLCVPTQVTGEELACREDGHSVCKHKCWQHASFSGGGRGQGGGGVFGQIECRRHGFWAMMWYWNNPNM